MRGTYHIASELGGGRKSRWAGNAGLALSAGITCAALMAGNPANAAEIQEPYTLSSVNGVLDVLMVARPGTLSTLTPQKPTGFVYDVCRRPTNGAEVCPAPPPGVNLYAGPRLALMQGDVLKVHLVNKLPMLTDAKHSVNPEEPGHAYLALNPTNIHTHGLLVSAHYPTANDPTYGDNVFALTFNGANGIPSLQASAHADVRMNSTDYSIKIPSNHPSGLYWIHPHVHGISVNQISAGLAGMITVGSVNDYVCATGTDCTQFLSHMTVRHLNMKDVQVLKDGTLMDQPDLEMCLSPTTGGMVLPALSGYCAGQDFSGQGDPDYSGAKWFHSVNGQSYPTITANSPGGEVWRLLNASASTTYNLSLLDQAAHTNMIFQVLSVDGVTVDTNFVQHHHGRFHVVACPGVHKATDGSGPLCTDQMLMMPSSRVELWVTYRNGNGLVTTPPPGATAIFRTTGYNTGDAGDTWPAVNLAQVHFTGNAPANPPQFLPLTVPPVVKGQQLAIVQDTNQGEANSGVTSAKCQPLPAGFRRRIYFNIPDDYADLFGLGYEVVDAHGNTVPGTYVPVTEFNAASPTVCLPLGPNNTSVTERWELVNLAGEDHNFHIHQTKFRVVSMPAQDGTVVPGKVEGTTVRLDNVPVLHATGGSNPNSPGGCAGPDEWKSGVCKSTPTVVDIPFYVAGDFVYHCHILEHEDCGMMARIRVLANGSPN